MISIIIPVYNGSKYIDQTIKSVIKQTYPNWELIIVNDGSTDNSLEIINHFTGCDEIRVISIPNSGISIARNTGVKLSRGDYIAFLDQDDIWAPTKLERQAALMQNRVDLSFTNTIFIDESGRELFSYRKFDNSNRGNILGTLMFDGFIAISSVMMRRKLFDDIGGFNPACKFAEDFDLLLRASEKANVDFTNEPLLFYRRHKNSFSYRKSSEMINETIDIVRKWREKRPDIFTGKYLEYLKFLVKQKFLLLQS